MLMIALLGGQLRNHTAGDCTTRHCVAQLGLKYLPFSYLVALFERQLRNHTASDCTTGVLGGQKRRVRFFCSKRMQLRMSLVGSTGRGPIMFRLNVFYWGLLRMPEPWPYKSSATRQPDKVFRVPAIGLVYV